MNSRIKFKDIILFEDDHYFVVNKPPNIATLDDRADPVNLLGLAKEYHPDAQAGHRLDKETSGVLVFEDDHYFVVNKPPNIATLDDRSYPVNLLGLAKEYHPDAQAGHRLDKETSGVLVFAKNPEAYRHLSLQFQKREVRKVYHAVSDGIHRFEDVVVDKPVLKLKDGSVRIARSGKPAITRFTTLHAYKMHTLIACRPVTGRMHQIRVHLAYLSAPITGDVAYGGKPFFLSSVKRDFNLKKDAEEAPLMKRVALHAFSIAFTGISGGQVMVEASYPKDMRALIRQLELNR